MVILWATDPCRTERAELSDAAVSLALRAAKVVRCDIAGVDLLPGPSGELYVIEVNAVPGWKALAATCGLDVAKEVVRFVASELGEGDGTS